MTRPWTRIAALLTLPACACACTTVTYRPLYPDTMKLAHRRAIEVLSLTMKSGDRYVFSPPAALLDQRIRTGKRWRSVAGARWRHYRTITLARSEIADVSRSPDGQPLRVRAVDGRELLVERLIEDSDQRLVFFVSEPGPPTTTTVVTFTRLAGDRDLTRRKIECGLTVADPDGPEYLVLERLNEDKCSVTVRARLVGLNTPLSAVAQIDSRIVQVDRKKVAIGVATGAVLAALRRPFMEGMAAIAAGADP